MQFFKHHTNMRNDIKLKRGIRRYGIKYYGLYNLIIESIAESLGTASPIPELEETAQDIAEQYNDDTALINEMMAHMLNQGLFEINDLNGRILCYKLYKFFDKQQTRSEELRKMIEYQKLSVCQETSQDGLCNSQDKSDRREEKRIEEKRREARFTPPTVEEVKAYLSELNEKRINANSFVNHYESNGWHVGKNKMKSWKAAVRTWISKQDEGKPRQEWPEFVK